MSGSNAVPLAPLAGAVEWLVNVAQVPSARVAQAFGITPNYLRVLRHRSRGRGQRRQQTGPTVSRLNVRPMDPFAPLSASRHARIEALHATCQRIFLDHAGGGDFLAGARKLKRLRQFTGFPSDIEWMRFRSHLHHRRAWFLVHSGHVLSAIANCHQAREYGTRAYRESQGTAGAKADLKLVVDAALIGSHANLLRNAPDRALEWLEQAGAAAQAAGHRLGSDYYRQRGVHLFQIGADDAAQKYFDKSSQIMEELGEASSPAELRYTGPRHSYFLKHNWDAAQQLVVDAGSTLSVLHTSVATHWAIAGGLIIDSPRVKQEALSLLEATPYPAEDFGHQRTIRFLLELTPELGLSPSHLRAWIRRALYFNAYRNN